MSLRLFRNSMVVCGLIWLACSMACSMAAEPPSNAGGKSDKGDVEELLGQLHKLQRSLSGDDSRQERIDSCQEIAKVAEKIRKLSDDDETVTEAAKAELDALTMLDRLGDEEAAARLKSLTADLSKDQRPAIANLMKVAALRRKMDELDPGDKKAVEVFSGEVKDVLKASSPDIQLLPLAARSVVLLHHIEKRQEAKNAAQEYAEKFAKAKSPEVQIGGIQLANLAGQIMQMEGDETQAAKFLRGFIDKLSKAEDSRVQQALESLDSSARRLEMVGKPMPVSGKQLEGKPFDISQYKGKVVLVDFWATWCGPCVKELPNVKETYKKYQDRGFEVVGISLDSDEDELRNFLKSEKLPWPILFGGGDDSDGWSHPMAKKYDVTSIPTAILLDQQGKVVSVQARGERLGELVSKLLER